MYTQLVSTCLPARCPPPKSNLLLDPGSYRKYWVSLLFAVENKIKPVEVLSNWEFETFGVSIYGGGYETTHFGLTLMRYVISPIQYTFGYIIDSTYNYTTKVNFITKYNKIPNIILCELNVNLMELYLDMAKNTIQRRNIPVFPGLWRIVLSGYPIEMLSCCQDPRFQISLLENTNYKSESSVVYNVKYLNQKNISTFHIPNKPLSDLCEIMVSLFFFRYQFVFLFCTMYWLLLIMIPSVVSCVVCVNNPSYILIIFKLLTCVIFIIIFRIYYKLPIFICTPILINLASVYCLLLSMDMLFIEIFNCCYMLSWFISFLIKASDKITFITNVRFQGILIPKMNIDFIKILNNVIYVNDAKSSNYIKQIRINYIDHVIV